MGHYLLFWSEQYDGKNVGYTGVLAKNALSAEWNMLY